MNGISNCNDNTNSNYNQLKEKIIELRNEIKELWSDLGNKDNIVDIWKPILSENYDNNLLKLYESKRDELLSEWNKITDNLDSFLDSLNENGCQTPLPSLQTSPLKRPNHANNNLNDLPNLDLNNNNNSNNSNNNNNNNRLLAWSDNGHAYSLANDNEMKEYRAKFAEKFAAESEDFRQFRETKRDELDYEKKQVSEMCTVEIFNTKSHQSFSGHVFWHNWELPESDDE